jgi:hypothetical protein
MDKMIKGSNKTGLVLCLILYFAVTAVLSPFFLYNIGPDATAYISAARKYLDGHHLAAVSTHWSPLLAWLLASLMGIGFSELVAMRLLMLFSGAAFVLAVDFLAGRLSVGRDMREVMRFIIAICAASYALLSATPDLLLATIIACYLGVVFDRSYPCRKYSSILAGMLAGLGYLAKSYALPFFILHFPLASLGHWLDSKTHANRRNIVMKTFIGFGVFILVAAIWLPVISAKAGHFTIGSAGTYNKSFIAPGSVGHPVGNVGLIPPPDAAGMSAWDDPSSVPVNEWSPFGSMAEFSHLVKVVRNNTVELLVVFTKWSVFSIPILLLFLALAIRDLLKRQNYVQCVLPFLTVALFASGFLPFVVKARYLWIVHALIVIMGMRALESPAIKQMRAVSRNSLMALFIVSCIVMPVANTVVDINKGKEVYELARDLKEQGVSGKLASYNNGMDSHLLSFHLKAQYYGRSADRSTEEETWEELKRHRIDYYLVWEKVDNLPEFLSGLDEPVIRLANLSAFPLHYANVEPEQEPVQ